MIGIFTREDDNVIRCGRHVVERECELVIEEQKS